MLLTVSKQWVSTVIHPTYIHLCQQAPKTKQKKTPTTLSGAPLWKCRITRHDWQLLTPNLEPQMNQWIYLCRTGLFWWMQGEFLLSAPECAAGVSFYSFSLSLAKHSFYSLHSTDKILHNASKRLYKDAEPNVSDKCICFHKDRVVD